MGDSNVTIDSDSLIVTIDNDSKKISFKIKLKGFVFWLDKKSLIFLFLQMNNLKINFIEKKYTYDLDMTIKIYSLTSKN